MGNASARLVSLADKNSDWTDDEYVEVKRVLQIKSKDPYVSSPFPRTIDDNTVHGALESVQKIKLQNRLYVESDKRRSQIYKVYNI